MDAAAGALKEQILFTKSPEQIGEGLLHQLALIDQIHRFPAARYLAVIMVYQGKEALKEGLPLFEQPCARPGQLRVIYVEQGRVGHLPIHEGPEEPVALLKDLIVFDKVLQIDRIELGKQGIQPTSPFFAAAGNDLNVIRGDDDSGEATDMQGELFILLISG